jgi:hypothetical protein
MRTFTILVSSVLLAVATGCSAAAPAPAKAPEPIVYDRAAFTPPSEFDMSFATPAQGTASKRSQPAEASYKARMVSMERPDDAPGR